MSHIKIAEAVSSIEMNTGKGIQWEMFFFILDSLFDLLISNGHWISGMNHTELWCIILSLFFFKTLQYCISFAKHQNECATGIPVLPILNPHYQIWFDLLLFCGVFFVSVFMRDIGVYFSRTVFIWLWY